LRGEADIKAGGRAGADAVDSTERRMDIIGRVVAINGYQAKMRIVPAAHGGHDTTRVTVGKFLGIDTGHSLVIGVLTSVTTENGASGDSIAQVDLLGEIKRNGRTHFQRGVSLYPAIGDPVGQISQDELRLVYDLGGPDTITIGTLQQDDSIGAYVHVDEMIRKHFAVLGTTGVGKSSGIALILQETMQARPDLRVFLIDPHNEYGRCFGDRAMVLSPKNLKLPFWLFNFEEIVDVFYRGRPGVEDEVEILSEVIPMAKQRFAGGLGAPDSTPTLRKNDSLRGPGYTIDTPVPYRLTDLLALIDERMGKLENKSAWFRYHRLMTRIETVRNDPRYTFMFDNANVGGDTMVDVVSQLFRLPIDGKPMTVMQLAGFPAEVVDSVVSVLARMAFDFGLWSDGAAPLLFVCEESHRYAPADRTIGFGPTRKAISRIAKEGRKYGVFLGLVTQRPAELDATIISQCSTLFAMRMANERDQNIVRSAVSDAAASLLAFVPSLGIREVFAFGEGVALPTRLRFKELPAHALPKSESIALVKVDPDHAIDRNFLSAVVERWREATMSGRVKLEDPTELDAFRKEFGVGGEGIMSESEKYRLKAMNAQSDKVKPFSGQPASRLRK
jgi:DNA helicase HerA-like ATPase